MAFEIKGDANIVRRVSAGLAVNMPDWQSGRSYLTNDMFLYNGDIYTVIADHTSTTSPIDDVASLARVDVEEHLHIVESEIDFTNAEPALGAEGSRYISTASGNGSITVGQVFTAGRVYVSNGVDAWSELMPREGHLAYVKSTDVLKTFNGSTWSSIGGGGTKVVEILTIASRNAINNLANVPASPVEFHVNGVLARTGITNAGQVITVDPVAIGFNIDPIVDSVVAIYNT